MKKVKLLLLFIFICSTIGFSQVLQDRGAVSMPFVRYESEDASIGGGAQLRSAFDFDQSNMAAEASGQQYVALPSNGSYLEWNIQNRANGMVIRFSMPDAQGGNGLFGSLALYVNGNHIQDVALSSYWSYQYFPNSEPVNLPGSRPRMRFDEVNFLLDSHLNPGDVVRIEKTVTSYEYGVDFIEIEDVPDPLIKPAGYLDVTDFGAVSNGTECNLDAFHNALTAAVNAGTGIYIPPGRFVLDDLFVFQYNNISMVGAGMWYTNLHFTNKGVMSGGIMARCTNSELAHFKLSTENNQRFFNDNHGQYMIYKGFMGTYGDNSSIHNTWVTHFECGAWIGGYDPPYPIDVTTNLTFAHNRIRNNYADGINLCQGTSHSIVEHNNFRNNGDDAIACWPNNAMNAPMAVFNTARYNTIEHQFRAGAIAFFGGNGHRIHNNLIKDGFASSGIRLTTDFPGFHFGNNSEGIHIYENTLINMGTSFDLWNFHRGALELAATQSEIKNIHFSDIDIIGAQRHGIQIGNTSSLNDITFENVTIHSYGLDGVTTSLFTSPTPGLPVLLYGGSSGAVDFNCLFAGDATVNADNADQYISKHNNVSYSVTDNECGDKELLAIELQPRIIELAVGESAMLDILFSPANATNKLVSLHPASSSVFSTSQIFSSLIEVSGLEIGSQTLKVTSVENPTIYDEIMINVLPTVSISTSSSEITEGGASGLIELSAHGISAPVTVNFTVSGTALPADYSVSPDLTGSVTLHPGNTTHAFSIAALPDDLLDGDKSFTITLQDGEGFRLGQSSATIIMLDATAPPFEAPVITFTSSKPLVDPFIDSIWGISPESEINKVVIGSPPLDFKGQWRAMYDLDNLYVLVEIIGVMPVSDSEEYWNDDAVDIYIDANNSKWQQYDGVYDFQFGFRWNDPVLHLGGNSVNNSSGVEFSMFQTQLGYNLQVSIPWQTLGVIPENRMLLGFDVGVNIDGAGGARQAQIVSFGTEMNWQNPSEFGNVPLLTSDVATDARGTDHHDIEAIVFPNPFSDKVKVLLSQGFEGGKINFRIMDVTGRLVYTKQFDYAESFNLDLSNFQSGVYLIIIQDEESTVLSKIVKQ